MSLSRRYRPQTFAEITDQASVKETLRKEIATGKIAHAYLFSGPRGVGKTTSARIFAKALNCLNLKDGEPCNACELCAEANEGRLIDLIEMDAASNTGVDNIREAIVEHVRFQPARGKFKVYILDEAHMLSTAAWNALLKTLEEPPPYAVFILATTERHKVPATILSRCQQFDFKRVPDERLAERVRELSKAEGISIEETVVMNVVRHSDGCVRDAETLLGQLVSLGEKNLTPDIASLVIPMSRLPIAANLLRVSSERQLAPALEAVGKLEEEGIPLLPIFDDLIESVRLLLIASESKGIAENLLNGDEGERSLHAVVGSFMPAELADIALMLMERRRDAKQGIDPRFALELAVTAIALGVLPHGPRAAAPAANQRPATIPVSSAQPVTAAPLPPPTQPKSESKPVIEEKQVAEPVAASAAPATPPAPTAQVPSTDSSEGTSLAAVQRAWPGFIRSMGETNPSLVFVLKTCRPIDANGTTVTVRFQYPFHRDKILTDLKNRRIVETTLATTLKLGTVHLEGVVGEDADVAEKRSADMVSNILKAFGGQVVEEPGEA